MTFEAGTSCDLGFSARKGLYDISKRIYVKWHFNVATHVTNKGRKEITFHIMTS